MLPHYFVSMFHVLPIGQKVEQNQKNELNESVSLIESGASFKYMDHYRMEGYTIIITDAFQNIVYPIEQSAGEQNFQILKMITDNQTIFASGNYNEKLTKKIFTNLISNAIFQSKLKSDIVITLRESSVTISSPLSSKYIVDQKQILQPFYSSGKNAGTGLGLYMVKIALNNSNYKYDIICRQTFSITISKK